MNKLQERIMKALIIGAVMGVTYEFIITPYISKPIVEKVDEVLDK